MSDNNSAYRGQRAQLIMSLKFHQSKTLSEMPLDVALEVVTQVWESCQPKPSQPSGQTKPDDVIYL